jgi:hypothetical protein
MAFSMQDLMARLPGSPGGQPMVAPSFNPQINKPQLATDVQVNKDIIKADKNQQLGLMLHALGGALRGDKNFVQNTMAIQTMQEGKKKEEERKKRYDEMMEKMDPNSPLYEFAKVMGSDGVDKIAEAQFDFATRKPAEEKYAQGADGLLRYTTGSRAGQQVFPGMTKPIKEMTPAEQIKTQEADVLKTLKTAQKEINAGTKTLEPGTTIIDLLDDYEKIILKNYIERAQQEDSVAALVGLLNLGSNQSQLEITKIE